MYRIIPKIEIKGSNLVKGINLEGLRILGNPNYFILNYYKNGADEIFIQDVVASLYDRYSLLNIIKDISKECFIPITVGGGIKSIEDIILVLTNGADRVSINSYAYKDIKFISRATKKFGSSTISFDAQIIKVDGKYMTFYDNGRTPSGYELVEWLNIVQNEGIGEIILTSVQNEGLIKGFDHILLDKCRKFINVPVLINGGLGNLDEIVSLKKKYDISGVLLGSVIHYNFFFDENISQSMINKNVKNKIDYFNTYKISEIKKYLIENKIEVML